MLTVFYSYFIRCCIHFISAIFLQSLPKTQLVFFITVYIFLLLIIKFTGGYMVNKGLNKEEVINNRKKYGTNEKQEYILFSRRNSFRK